MKRLLVGFVLTAVLLVHALAPPQSQAWWRWGGYYRSNYYGCNSYYRPSYYGSGCCSSNGYGYNSMYGYPGNAYGAYYGSPAYGWNGMSGMGGGSSLLTVLAMTGGLNNGNASMYLNVPMSNGFGPSSYLQVPLGGAVGRPTYMQVPMGGSPGSPVYLQMPLGAGSTPAPTGAAPGPLSKAVRAASDPLTVDEPKASTVKLVSAVHTSTTKDSSPTVQPGAKAQPITEWTPTGRSFSYAAHCRTVETTAALVSTPVPTATPVVSVATSEVHPTALAAQ